MRLRRRNRRAQLAGGLTVFAALAALALPAVADATPLSYTFDSSREGWRVSQDNGFNVASASFQATGGNPGGHLTATDSGVETGCPGGTPCDLLYFYSPVLTGISLAGNYGGTASFDLRSSVEPEFGAEFLLLPPGDVYLDGLISDPSGTTYHSLSIPLNEAGNWAVCPYAGGTCSTPDQATFKSLLGASDVVAVMGDVADGTGEDYDLDNVSLTDGPPPPPPAVVPTARKKCKKKKKKRHAAVAKRCKKKKKHRSAAISRVRG
jgi:hypothetical protein